MIKVRSPWRFCAIVCGSLACYALGDGSLAIVFAAGAFVGSFEVEFR